ncbi:MAG TPA: peptide chain release factor N(5)-glutamine methyltransferase [Novimethylophilus sp.]|jgi:release factor glutamine methyltransferase|uniref:peptide chain release factor N(5)-glutamine methyltransferase n=1 Tax=Novimethylophilus sp. TaxID=2137426 RepID=UPI002F42F123
MLAPSTIAQLLQNARRQIAQALQLPDAEARIEAQALLRQAVGAVSRAWLIAHEHDIPSPAQAAVFQQLLQRRLAGEPVAYLLGEREFYGLDFSVTPAVLIPRPDTETLVDAALTRIPPTTPCRVLDMGAGSGAIAIAIARHRPQARVTGIDSSPTALEVARDNARKLGAGNAEFHLSHWFAALAGEQFDVIVSNPPYIAADDPHLAQGDLRFEPAAALASGADGLDDIRLIVRAAPAHLVGGGWLLLEHGYDQAEAVAKLLRKAGFGEVGSGADLAGVMRVTQGRLP